MGGTKSSETAESEILKELLKILKEKMPRLRRYGEECEFELRTWANPELRCNRCFGYVKILDGCFKIEHKGVKATVELASPECFDKVASMLLEKPTPPNPAWEKELNKIRTRRK